MPLTLGEQNTAVALPTEAAVDAAADLPYPLVDMNFTGDDGAKAVGTAQVTIEDTQASLRLLKIKE